MKSYIARRKAKINIVKASLLRTMRVIKITMWFMHIILNIKEMNYVKK